VNHPLLQGLNPEQHRAVVTLEGPVLVLAGAGTGKTRVITVRTAWLMEKGVHPSNVLAVTFTNKAAREMRARIGKLVGKARSEELTVGTFHAFAARTLREFAERMDLPKKFAICDASDQLAAVKSAMRELRVGDTTMKPQVAHARISLLKNKLVEPERFLDQACDDQEELLGRVYIKYEEMLRRQRTLDFDDLLLFALRLLRQDEDVRLAFQQRYRFVMVDEYQDTNGPQYEIIRLIAGEHRNLCVVGDDDQSIYGWRGADVEKILGFEKDYPGAEVVRLETNYRSTARILNAANRVIACNPTRHEKRLRSALGDGEAPVVLGLEDEIEEADFIVDDIARRLRNEWARAGDIAILYRTQQQPRPIEAQLRSCNVPYVLIGGMSFFDRKEVRDVMAYIRLLVNPEDEASLLRIINRPARGIGKGSVDKIIALATEHGVTANEACSMALQQGILSNTATTALTELRETMTRFASPEPTDDIASRIGSLLEAVSYRAEVDRCYPDQSARRDRWNGVLEIFDMVENYTARTAKPLLTDFLERVALSQDDSTKEDSGERNAVTLMTMHSAKGLEFPEVYLAGVEEGLLPHARAVEENTVEEERRLTYVGITRAKARLTVTHARSRSRFGTRTDSMRSRFLFEMEGIEPPEDWRPAQPRGDTPAPNRGKPKASKKKSGRKAASKKSAATGRKRASRKKPSGSSPGS
jgi:DNA helicase-2/ATP-dependent DNA helicase PcrA